ncbi:MAG: hypothetical protein ABGZ53_23690, partial [Fuerstiella sp.]
GDDPYGDDASTGTQPLRANKPPPRTSKRKKQRSRSETAGSDTESHFRLTLDNPLLWIAAALIPALFVYITTMINLKFGGLLFSLIVSPAGLVAFVASLGVLVKAFQESVFNGLLCLFIPFFIFYWVATEWHTTRKMFQAWMLATLVWIPSHLSYQQAVRAHFVDMMNRMIDTIESHPKTDEPPPQVSVEDGKKAIAGLLMRREGRESSFTIKYHAS